MFWGVHDVLSHGFAKRGSPGTSVAYFAHLKKYHNAELIYDPSDPVIDKSLYEVKDWASSEFGYLDRKEVTPPNMPEPRGQGFVVSMQIIPHTLSQEGQGLDIL